MSSNVSAGKPSNDEINLSDLLYKILGFLGRLFKSLITFVRLILAKWWLFLLLILLGAAAGYGIHNLRRPYYGYSMTVLLSEVRNDFVDNLVDNLTLLVNEKNYEQLGKQLNVSAATAAQVKTISFQNLDQNRIEPDSILNGAPFLINVELYSSAVHDSIEKGIVHYLETNPYLSKQKQIKREHLESIIAKIKRDIATIDSTKAASINPRGPVNGFVYGEPLDPTNLYKESVGMYERQTSLEATLKRMEFFDVFVHFAPRKSPSGPDRNKHILAGAFAFFLLGLLFTLYQEWKYRKYGLFSSPLNNQM